MSMSQPLPASPVQLQTPALTQVPPWRLPASCPLVSTESSDDMITVPRPYLPSFGTSLQTYCLRRACRETYPAAEALAFVDNSEVVNTDAFHRAAVSPGGACRAGLRVN